MHKSCINEQRMNYKNTDHKRAATVKLRFLFSLRHTYLIFAYLVKAVLQYKEIYQLVAHATNQSVCIFC